MLNVPRRSEKSRALPGEPPRPGFLTRKALLWTGPPALIYALQTLFLKIGHNRLEEPLLAFLWVAFGWIVDLLFVIPLFALFTGLASSPKRAVRTASVAVYEAVIVFSLLFTAADAAYKAVTGSALTWNVVRYFWQTFADSRALVFGEATAPRLAWVVVPVAACILHLLVMSFRHGRGIRGSDAALSRRKSWFFVGGLTALWIGLLLVVLTGGRRTPDQRCVAFDAIWRLVPGTGVRVKLPILTDEERFDDAWAFEREPFAPRLNVVLFIFESLSWKATDVYVPGLGTTPYLGELAKSGQVVEDFYTVVPHTTKALVPILAGYYPYLEQAPKEATPGLLPRKSLATILEDQGYATAFFQPANDFERRPDLVRNLGYGVFRNLFSLPQEGFDDVNYFGKEEAMMLEPSLAWVDGQKGQPFFLTYLTLSSHHQYGFPKSYRPVDFDAADPVRDRYLNAVHYTDGFLRSVTAAFEARHLTEKTLFLIIGDHGEAFGEHGGYQHNQILWEEGLRTMAVLFAPSFLPGGRTIEGVRSILDVVPTACDAVGLRLVQGRFLGESLLRPVSPQRKLFFSGWSGSETLAMREGPVKVIYHPPSGLTEVYDNSTDAFDQRDLAGQGPYAKDFLDQRKNEMLRWKAVVDFQYALWELARGKEPKIGEPGGSSSRGVR